MNYKLKRLLCMALLLLALVPAMKAEDFSAKEVVLEHIKDSHDWHVTDLGEGTALRGGTCSARRSLSTMPPPTVCAM